MRWIQVKAVIKPPLNIPVKRGAVAQQAEQTKKRRILELLDNWEVDCVEWAMTQFLGSYIQYKPRIYLIACLSLKVELKHSFCLLAPKIIAHFPFCFSFLRWGKAWLNDIYSHLCPFHFKCLSQVIFSFTFFMFCVAAHYLKNSSSCLITPHNHSALLMWGP